MTRALATLCLALAAVLASTQFASAGGWAVTAIDNFPESLVAGERYEIGYTIRQHGVTPIDVERMGGTTEIRGASASGETFSFRGARSGPTGHYVASVAVPSAGRWARGRWRCRRVRSRHRSSASSRSPSRRDPRSRGLRQPS